MSKLNLVIEEQTHLDNSKQNEIKENKQLDINKNSNGADPDDEEEQIIKNINLLYSYKIIDGMKFSPIDINVCTAKIIKLSPLKWINLEQLPKKIKLTNTGKTLILSAKWTCERPYIIGGPLQSKYVFSQIHFHWGKTALEGSEHTIDGYRMPLEMHVIHFKKVYLNQTEALKYDDGVICLVYMFQIRSNHNPIIHEIVSKLNEIQIADTTIEIPSFQLTKLIFTFDSDYYLYWGCAIKSGSKAIEDNRRQNDTKDIIINNAHDSKHLLLWFISRETTNLSYEQLGLFRQLLNFKLCPIIRNWRCIQEQQQQHIQIVNLKLQSQIFHINPMNAHTNSTLSPISKRFEIDRIHHQSSTHNTNRRNSLKNDYIVRTLMDNVRI